MGQILKGAPVESKKRYVILDALRGFAILGICMANYPEFSLYSFMTDEETAMMTTAGIDKVVKWFLYLIIDGKFYTIFSLLFGVGFSIIINNSRNKGINGTKIFYRRMTVLFIIGLLHLILIWSGDILMLYAIVGMTLPLFVRLKDKTLLLTGGLFLLVPVIVDTICDFTHTNLSSIFVGCQNYYSVKYGIEEVGFAYWLSHAQHYGDVLKFLVMGAFERMVEFVDGNRYFKVLGLFLIGLYLGRNRYYADLKAHIKQLQKICLWGLCIGLPLSSIYAWSCIDSHPWGLSIHSLLYFISVYLTSFGYVALFCLLYLKKDNWKIWKILSFPGKMALTNYIGQSVIGMFIFYGIGFGLGSHLGLVFTELIAVGVFIFEIILSYIWLKPLSFRFGPLEWIWRCLTYNKYLPIR